MGAERDRVEGFGRPEDGLRDASDWYLWGPYVSERQWGTVREDYSAGGDAWNSLPHDHARSRAYRWGEDGLAGFCDVEQRLCLGLALWNGADPILKERVFGLAGPQGNHGEDAKEYWWYLDAVPSHAWNRWRYHYPQAEFPYGQLVAENARRGRYEAEYELLDTGAFDDDRYWIVDVDYAKAAPLDVLVTVRVTNAGPDAATLHVLPTAWFRNTWSWGDDDEIAPQLRAGDGPAGRHRPPLPRRAGAGRGGGTGRRAADGCCSATTRRTRRGCTASPPPRRTPRTGSTTTSWPAPPRSTRRVAARSAPFWFTVDVEAGETVELRLRLRPVTSARRPARPAGPPTSARTSRRCAGPAAPRPTSSTRTWRPRGRRPTRPR